MYKKSAMLSLGERIKKSCHAEFVSVSRIFCNKSGAMFGLDARIALAIFGALSVISGVSLYGVLNNIENLKIKNEVNEIVKAYEQYVIDTRTEPPISSGTYEVRSTPLVDNSANVKGWKGPYWSNTTTYSGFKVMNFSSIDNVRVNYVRADDLPWNGTSATGHQCSSANGAPTCYIWVGLYPKTDALTNELYPLLEKLYDDGVMNSKDGNVRWYHEAVGYNYIRIKTIPSMIR